MKTIEARLNKIWEYSGRVEGKKTEEVANQEACSPIFIPYRAQGDLVGE